MAKRIVSHYGPDLDSITCVWLLTRFAAMEGAQLEFVSAGSTFENMPVDSDPDTVHVDTGRGRFDHHGNAQGEASGCAASLVAQAYAPTDPAVKRLVNFVDLVDQGKVPFEQMIEPFSIARLVRGLKIIHSRQAEEVVRLILPCLDAWYASAQEEVAFQKDWERRREFPSKWGLGIAMASDIPAASMMAYNYGAAVFVFQGSDGSLGITAAPTSRADLTEVYEKLRTLEPTASWYLHPSQKMLLCGSGKTKGASLSHMKLSDLVDLLVLE